LFIVIIQKKKVVLLLGRMSHFSSRQSRLIAESGAPPGHARPPLSLNILTPDSDGETAMRFRRGCPVTEARTFGDGAPFSPHHVDGTQKFPLLVAGAHLNFGGRRVGLT